jgi:hypothetical protein
LTILKLRNVINVGLVTMAAWNRIDPDGDSKPSTPDSRRLFMNAIEQGDVAGVETLAAQLPSLVSTSIADGGLHALHLAASRNQVMTSMSRLLWHTVMTRHS